MDLASWIIVGGVLGYYGLVFGLYFYTDRRWDKMVFGDKRDKPTTKNSLVLHRWDDIKRDK